MTSGMPRTPVEALKCTTMPGTGLGHLLLGLSAMLIIFQLAEKVRVIEVLLFLLSTEVLRDLDPLFLAESRELSFP